VVKQHQHHHLASRSLHSAPPRLPPTTALNQQCPAKLAENSWLGEAADSETTSTSHWTALRACSPPLETQEMDHWSSGRYQAIYSQVATEDMSHHIPPPTILSYCSLYSASAPIRDVTPK
jgi:hypothetical protein